MLKQSIFLENKRVKKANFCSSNYSSYILGH